MVARNSKEEEMANKEAEKKKRKRERDRVCIVCHTYILLSSYYMKIVCTSIAKTNG
jgi:hypothetical protein